MILKTFDLIETKKLLFQRKNLCHFIFGNHHIKKVILQREKILQIFDKYRNLCTDNRTKAH